MTWYPPKYYAEMRKLARAQAAKLTSLQALKLQGASPQAPGQGVKLQARVIQFQDQGARVQAKVPKLQGTSNKDKGIFFMSYMK